MASNLTTTPLAQVFESASEADLVESVLRAVDECSSLVRESDLGGGIHRFLTPTEFREDLTLLEEGLSLNRLRLTHRDRSVDQFECPFEIGDRLDRILGCRLIE
jgi:hypothetical protein